MAAAGRKQLATTIAVVAMVMLVAAADAAPKCGVSSGTLGACLSYCAKGGDSSACCAPLRNANFRCLCDNYWHELQSMPSYAKCVDKIKHDCGINKSC